MALAIVAALWLGLGGHVGRVDPLLASATIGGEEPFEVWSSVAAAGGRIAASSVVVDSEWDPVEQLVAVFASRDGKWVEEAVLRPEDGRTEFGSSVATTGDVLVVGAPRHSNLDFEDRAYVYVREGERWTLETILRHDTRKSLRSFGKALAMDGDTFVVGAPGDPFHGSSEGRTSGRAYVYRRVDVPGTSEWKWSLAFELEPEIEGLAEGHAAWFGQSVALRGSTVVVGSPGAREQRGNVRIFDVQGDTSTLRQVLEPPSGGPTRLNFGQSVALLGDTLLVGCPRWSTGDEPTGRVHAYTRVGGRWEPAELLEPPSGTTLYGWSVALASQDQIAVGGTTGGLASVTVLTRVPGTSFANAQVDALVGLGSRIAADDRVLAVGGREGPFEGAYPAVGPAYAVQLR